MISAPPNLVNEAIETYGRFFEAIAHLPAEKCARDVLDENKVHDQLALFARMTGNEGASAFRGKKLLEVGSGMGILLAVARRDYGIESFGIEPSGTGFESSHRLGRRILESYGEDPEIMCDAVGESLPFPDDSFDLIFSSTVLEHTRDPHRVLREAIRVCRPGGFVQFSFPNYGSFWEGHYAVPWVPYMNHCLARCWIRFWGRDPSFMETIQLLNAFKVRRWAEAWEDVEVLSYGREIFRERIDTLDFGDWAGLGRLKAWLRILKRLGLLHLAGAVVARIQSFEPILLTLKKR